MFVNTLKNLIEIPANFQFARNVLMSSLLALVSVAILLLACNSQSANKPPHSSQTDVSIQIKGFNGGTARLIGIVGDQYYVADSFPISDEGKIHVSRDSLYPGGLYFISLPDDRTSLSMIFDTDQQFSMLTNIQHPVMEMQVSGSLENELLYNNLKFETSYQQRFRPLRQQYAQTEEGTAVYADLEDKLNNLVQERKDHLDALARDYPDAFFTKFKLAGQNPELQDTRLPDGSPDPQLQAFFYRDDYWKGYDFSDERLLRTPVYHNKLETFFGEVVPQRVDSLIKYVDLVTRQSMQNDSVFKFTANYLGIKYKEPKFMGADAVYVYMIRNFFTKELAFWSDGNELDRLRLDADIRDISMLGKQARDIAVTSMNGEEISLYDINAPITVLYIYNTQCENCQKETPLVREVYQNWKARGLEVFALSTDDDPQLWRKYISENGLNWINAIDPEISSNYTFKYHIDVTPEIYVLDREKVIIAKDLKAFQLPVVLQQKL